MSRPVAPPDRRLMLVHAHPDDESSTTGATIATYADQGAGVTLVTCTLGERGDIVLPELAHLSHDQENALAQVRVVELTEAMAALGVTDFVRLGGDGRWHDTGMVFGPDGMAAPPPDADEASFWRADLLEAANALVPLIRDRRPQVLITYDEFGFYGHPDHIQAHRVATYAIALAAVPSYRPDLGEPWQVQRVLWPAYSESQMRTMIAGAQAERQAAIEAGEDRGEDFFADFDLDSGQRPPMCVADDDIAVRVDGYPVAAQRFAALRAHRSQIKPDEFFFALEGSPPGLLWQECYRLAGGAPPPAGATDIFAGLSID
ncbi:N-acetyl-1-D-myo-inositol-2-amino-2-deoxy-alpha-D-glucopyranoside deacetylase [Branchiibius hedensis]|uniref:N-acetyl-1-D-myo-inositol-2-amino-2-deoxy-alpha-D-glucopyranoside deacetylase n=1 Tax=Branchiibius hedensis TaxID=672460 RepID=A0A2Y8ZL27_9MICO|nr:N-acetyl-1-D-myo-inositol-2-amino-2-deoxy-alpha-D-glucopyranoside deacetylase [Branchiibius hedensis]PWJ24223.1 N-acetyl-1-D-myo-inositol-2-amino-2-deoxy-alpha-D-glucopyranoside deacetylase [Branchiibius hedensis]SSA33040.1 N-acetyl-1-D-myo-inositol-2-amino-2-deoxy-alpha-D-glucopyranoside deacetylase [Branchiibius hedensis]